jgi:hypothetical protein
MSGSIMGKVVQTEIDPSEYGILEAIVKKRRLTIKQAVREAIESWVGLQTPLEEDPLFKLKPARTGVRTDSAKLDEALYGRRRR